MRHQDKVLLIISELPLAYGSAIHQKLEEAMPPSKWFPNWKLWDAIRSPNFGSIYNSLQRLEEAGLLTSEWETPEPIPGKNRRRYYYLTDQGKERVAELKSLPPALAA